MASVERELTKEQWYPIVYDILIDSGDKFDDLKVLSISLTYHYKGKTGVRIWRVNYKTTRGDWSTGFGTLEIKTSELEKMIRDSKIRRILK